MNANVTSPKSTLKELKEKTLILTMAKETFSRTNLALILIHIRLEGVTTLAAAKGVTTKIITRTGITMLEDVLFLENLPPHIPQALALHLLLARRVMSLTHDTVRIDTVLDLHRKQVLVRRAEVEAVTDIDDIVAAVVVVKTATGARTGITNARGSIAIVRVPGKGTVKRESEKTKRGRKTRRGKERKRRNGVVC